MSERFSALAFCDQRSLKIPRGLPIGEDMSISRIPASTAAQTAAVPTPSRKDPAVKAETQAEKQPETPAPLAQRLANMTSKVEARVANAIEKGELNERQIHNLRNAAEKFEALMNRIGNADFQNGPKRQVLYALHQFSNDVSAVLNPQPTESLTQAVGETKKFDKLA